jgi:thiol-disulfide isomerase/thioredoxin
MLEKVFCLAIFVAVTLLARSEPVNLTFTTLNQQLSAHKTMIVMFYAPWCGHSKEAQPIWEEMAELMAQNSQDKDIFVGKVDCVAEPDAYWQEDIKSFPTIKAYVNHNALPIVYDGERVANTMWRYFRLLSRQYVDEISSVDEFAELQETKLSRAKPLVLAMLEPTDSVTDDNLRNRKIDGACKKADRTTCVISRNPELATSLGVAVPSVTVFTQFEALPGEASQIDEPTTRTDLDTLSAADLATWLQDHSFPPLVELTADNSALIFSQQRNGFQNHFLFLLHDVRSQSGRQTLETIRRAGKTFLGKAVFIYIDMAELSDYSADVLQSLQISLPTNGEHTKLHKDAVHAVLSRESALRFYSGLDTAGDLSDEGTIGRWVEGVLAGLVEPVRTSSFEK